MSSAEARKDQLTMDDFIAYGSDSLDDASCLTDSSSGALPEPTETKQHLPESVSQPFKRGIQPRPTEQKTLGTPQWYIKKIQDKTSSRKQMADLQGLLQSDDSEWVRQFVQLNGMTILAQRLYQLSRRSSPRQDDIHVEFEVVKCISHIINHHAHATRIALAQNPQELVTHIAAAVGIPHLPTRALILHILVFLVYWNESSVYDLVINGLEALSEDNDYPIGCYSFWFSTLLSLLSGRGKMGTVVGASPDFRRSGAAVEETFAEYLISNIWLINGILDALEGDLELRLHHRSLMESSGLQTILDITRSLNIPSVNNHLGRLQERLDGDAESLAETMERNSVFNLSDPGEVFDTICVQTQDTKAQAHLLSILQHLLLIRHDDRNAVHRFQVIDSVVTDLVMDNKLGGAEKRLGLSVERLVGQLEQTNKAKAHEDDLIKSCSAVLQLKAENQDLEERMAHTEALLGTLQAEIARLQAELSKSSHTLESPKSHKAAASADAALKENIPLTPQRSSAQPVIPRLAFRGFSSWFSTPQASPAGSPAMISRRSPFSGAFNDDDDRMTGNS